MSGWPDNRKPMTTQASAFERADQCLYQAKSDGRNKIVVQDQI